MTVEQKINSFNRTDSIRIFNRLTGTEYFYGAVWQFTSTKNAENYNSVKDCIVVTDYHYKDVHFLGVDIP